MVALKPLRPCIAKYQTLLSSRRGAAGSNIPFFHEEMHVRLPFLYHRTRLPGSLHWKDYMRLAWRWTPGKPASTPRSSVALLGWREFELSILLAIQCYLALWSIDFSACLKVRWLHFALTIFQYNQRIIEWYNEWLGGQMSLCYHRCTIMVYSDCDFSFERNDLNYKNKI